MSKPSEFHIGVLDFFAILLPGAIATALMAKTINRLVFVSLIPAPTSEAGNWAAYLTCSYFLGHLIFLIGSSVDRIYDKWRTRFRPYGNESAYQRATSIRDSIINKNEQSALNTFQWSRSVLLAMFPAGAEDVRRLEADSKFFRSLLVVFAIASITFFIVGRPYFAMASFLLLIPCVLRYSERRLKSTTQAYIHIITAFRLGILFKKSTSELA